MLAPSKNHRSLNPHPSNGEAKGPDRFSSCLYAELIMETVVFSMKNEPGGREEGAQEESVLNRKLLITEKACAFPRA